MVKEVPAYGTVRWARYFCLLPRYAEHKGKRYRVQWEYAERMQVWKWGWKWEDIFRLTTDLCAKLGLEW